MGEAGIINVDHLHTDCCIQVPGKFELKGHDRVKELESFNTHNEDQYLPRQRRGVTYVSRLQSVQAAVDFQLGELAKTHPAQRVALVTFSDEVRFDHFFYFQKNSPVSGFPCPIRPD